MSDSASAGSTNPTSSTQQPHDVTEEKIAQTEEDNKEAVTERLKEQRIDEKEVEVKEQGEEEEAESVSIDIGEPQTAVVVADLEHTQEPNLNSSITSMNSNRGVSRGFSAFPPIRFTRSIQNSNWRENLSNNLTSVIQEFRPVFQPNSSTSNRSIIANLSNYRVPSNSSFR